MKKPLSFFFAILVLFFGVFTSTHLRADATFYVSPSGRDSNPGTQTAPFATIPHARDAVRALLPKMNSDITVYLAGGDYALSQPITFTAADSGQNGHVVVYRNTPGQTPVLNGGIVVSGWTQHDGAKNIWQASVPAGATFRQLYVNGAKANLTRSNDNLGLTVTPTGYSSSSTFLKSLSSSPAVTDMEIVTTPYWWEELILPVAAITSDGNVTFQHPAADLLKTSGYPTYVGPIALQNAYELLAKPGDFYLQHRTNIVFYIPRPSEDMATAKVEAPLLEQLIVLAGKPDLPVSNLRFEGLSFQNTTWLLAGPGYGMLSEQANQPDTGADEPNPSARTVKAAIDGSWERNIDFSQCTFNHLGGDGLNILKGSKNVAVDHCSFHDLSASAIQVALGWEPDAKLPVDSPEIVENVILANNDIHDIGTDYPEACGIFVGFTRNCSILHNSLHNLAYSGISLGWGWNRTLPLFTSGNFIEGNLVYDYLKARGDGGAVYVNGVQYHGTISHNFAYNQGGLVAVYYLDDDASNWSVFENVAHRGWADCWYLYKGSNNHAYGNFADNATVGTGNHPEWYQNLILPQTLPCTCQDNTIVTDGKWPDAALSIVKAAGPEASTYYSSRPESILVDETHGNGGFSQGLQGWAPVTASDPNVLAGGCPDADTPTGETCVQFKGASAALQTTFNALAGHDYALSYSQAVQGQQEEQSLTVSIGQAGGSHDLAPSMTHIPGLYARFVRTFSSETSGPVILRFTYRPRVGITDSSTCALDRVELRDVTPPQISK